MSGLHDLLREADSTLDRLSRSAQDMGRDVQALAESSREHDARMSVVQADLADLRRDLVLWRGGI